MNIFVSYSVEDIELVKKVIEQLKIIAKNVFWWEESREPGKEVWPTIHKWIDQSDVVLAILTGRTLSRAMAVGNEIGYARAKGKTIIPLVSQDVQTTDLGCLAGITYQTIDRNNPKPAVEVVKKQIESLRSQSTEAIGGFLIVAGIIVGLLFLSGKN